MACPNYKYIYGPVPSWRLGNSLGIDPLSGEMKICSFDCLYCQIGRTRLFSTKRQVFVPTKNIIDEIKSLPAVDIDCITFSGSGEPTLAKNLGNLIRSIKRARREKIAILTNSSLINRKDVRKDLMLCDFVVAKLDAASEDVFRRVSGPAKGVTLARIVKGIKSFKKAYKGRFGLQIMFLPDNKGQAREIALLARDIGADEVQLNTPLRPCAARPVSKQEMATIKRYFKGMNVVSVYDAKRKKTKPFSVKDTVRRRGEI